MYKAESFWSFVKSSGLNPLHFEVNIMNNLNDLSAGGNALKMRKEDYDPKSFYSLRVNGQLPEYMRPEDRLVFQRKTFTPVKKGGLLTITIEQREKIFNSICEYGDRDQYSEVPVLRSIFESYEASTEGAGDNNQPFNERYEAWRGKHTNVYILMCDCN